VRIAVVSDIHGNLAALDAVLADAGSIDAVWCLGDVVGYGAEPNECIERLRRLGALCIAGNHDWAAVGRAEVENFTRDAAVAARWTAGQLEASNRTWLAARPEIAVAGDATLAHGSPRDPIWEYVLSAPVALRSLNCFETPLCLIGHSHIPSWFATTPDGGMSAEYAGAGREFWTDQGRLLANPGSVGQPRDQDPRAAYLVYDSDCQRLRWRRVRYAIRKTQRKILHAGLPPRLAERLAIGR
jgi:diadenosine tetraphosphatase ApaH/serine/threonine PP2A family protein phosphatase